MRIKKVKFLESNLRRMAEEMGFSSQDLVLVDKNKIIEKVKGDPVSYLIKRASEHG